MPLEDERVGGLIKSMEAITAITGENENTLYGAQYI